MTAQTKVEADERTAVWDSLSKTDPRHTKRFKRAGGFEGTALKPIWVERRLTEVFGPFGKGWGTTPPAYTIHPGANNEILVFCNITGWYLSDGERHEVHGAGGDKIVRYVPANEKYKRPERWESNDEAYKMAMTDAMLNAFKHIGVGADVHMGQFDDAKYVRELQEEIERDERQQKQDAKAPSKTAVQKGLKELTHHMGTIAEMGEWYQLKNKYADLIGIVERDYPDWWNGWPYQPDGFTPLRRKIEMLEADLSAQSSDENEFGGVSESDLAA